MKVTPQAHGAVAILLEAKEAETFGLMIANDVIGEIGHGESGLAEGILETGPEETYWGREDIAMSDAGELARDLLKGLGGFDRAVEIIDKVLDF